VNGETHKYIFDGWSITAETNKDGELKSREVRGYGLVKKETNNKQYYYHQNEHGDITHLTNTDSEVENSYQYDVFGNIREQQENVENVFKYAGEQLDNETQQYYLRARFYNPVIARFTQEDVYRGDGLNLYVYVVNNPLLWIDPSGHAKCPNNPIEEYEVTTYDDFNKRSVQGDGLEGHEVWQHANLNENGYATTRLSTDVSKNNLVIALPHDVHVEVNREQRSFNARTQTPSENVHANIEILYNNARIPRNKIDELLQRAMQHIEDVTRNTRNP